MVDSQIIPTLHRRSVYWQPSFETLIASSPDKKMLEFQVISVADPLGFLSQLCYNELIKSELIIAKRFLIIEILQ